jgi:hypothetical protein
VVGPDGNLYVTSAIFEGNHPGVLRYDGRSGTFLGVFASQNITSPRGVLFGPDGNLYVANGNEGADPASVERFDGQTGAFIDYFVAPDSGGLKHPSYMVFGPNGSTDGKLDLYVGAPHDGSVLRYDGATGVFKDVFVSPGSGGLNATQGVVFGPDGSLFVASGNWFASSNGPFYPRDFPAGAILHFEGPSGAHPGALVGTGTFIAGGVGGLANPAGIVFGPDPSGNGRMDLYVASSLLHGPGNLNARNGTSDVLRYDAETGAFLGTFVTPDSGGLKFATFITFTETDPTTLNYNGGEKVSAAGLATRPAHATLRANQTQPLLAEALHRWEIAGIDVSALHGIDVRVADLGGMTLGLAAGHTIWLDDNAAGWGWFVDKTPSNDSEFTRPGNQGELHRMDLLTVLEHEVGHLLGREHEGTGVMIDTLPAGTRRAPANGIDQATRLDGRDLARAIFDANPAPHGIGGNLVGLRQHAS